MSPRPGSQPTERPSIICRVRAPGRPRPVKLLENEALRAVRGRALPQGAKSVNLTPQRSPDRLPNPGAVDAWQNHFPKKGTRRRDQ